MIFILIILQIKCYMCRFHKNTIPFIKNESLQKKLILEMMQQKSKVIDSKRDICIIILSKMFQETSSTGISTSSHDFGRLQDMACRIAEGIASIPPSELQQMLKNLQQTLSRGNHQEVALAITILTSMVKNGQSTTISQNQKLLKALVKQFNKMAEELQDNVDAQMQTSKLQYKMLSLLSFVSQIIHENKGCNFPYGRVFVNNLFMISTDCVAKSTWKKETSRILSVILEKLSEKPNILLEYGLFPRFRQILLGNFRVIQDKKSFERLMRSVRKVSAIQPYSLKELVSCGAVQSVEKFFGKDMINFLLTRLNLHQTSLTALSQKMASTSTQLQT